MPRAFFAAGPGRSTEDAVGRLLLVAEDIGPKAEEAACLILDIENVMRM